jgi:sugar-specific transcriptional regulator TrmB
MIKDLQEFGLHEKEARVYLATLELVQATVQQIASRAGVNRATTYVQLEALKDRGLVSQVNRDKKTFYIAEAPDKIAKIIEKEKVDVLFREKQLKNLLPNLQALFNAGKDRPNVRFFEGAEGVAACREEIASQQAEQFYAIVKATDDQVNVEKQLPFIKKIKDYRLIYIAARKIEDLQAINRAHKGFKARFLPQGKLDIETEIVILRDKFWLSNMQGKPLGVLIEDKLMAETMRGVFNLIWGICEE